MGHGSCQTHPKELGEQLYLMGPVQRLGVLIQGLPGTESQQGVSEVTGRLGAEETSKPEYGRTQRRLGPGTRKGHRGDWVRRTWSAGMRDTGEGLALRPGHCGRAGSVGLLPAPDYEMRPDWKTCLVNGF